MKTTELHTLMLGLLLGLSIDGCLSQQIANENIRDIHEAVVNRHEKGEE